MVLLSNPFFLTTLINRSKIDKSADDFMTAAVNNNIEE